MTDRRDLARRIAEALFSGGLGRADRLVLTVGHGRTARDLGGWSEDAVVDLIAVNLPPGVPYADGQRHPGDDVLLRFVRCELRAGDDTGERNHVAGCLRCNERIDQLLASIEQGVTLHEEVTRAQPESLSRPAADSAKGAGQLPALEGGEVSAAFVYQPDSGHEEQARRRDEAIRRSFIVGARWERERQLDSVERVLDRALGEQP